MINLSKSSLRSKRSPPTSFPFYGLSRRLPYEELFIHILTARKLKREVGMDSHHHPLLRLVFALTPIALFTFSHLHYNVIQRGCEAISG